MCCARGTIFFYNFYYYYYFKERPSSQSARRRRVAYTLCQLGEAVQPSTSRMAAGGVVFIFKNARGTHNNNF